MNVFMVILIFLYFIKKQFEFNPITPLGYWIIPLLSLYEFFLTFKWSLINLVLLLGILLFASAVGHYQAKHTKIQLEEIGISYFRDLSQNEVPIYRKSVTSEGGRHYLYGWLITIIIQLLIEAFYLGEHLTVGGIWEDFFREMVADILTVYRFSGIYKNVNWTIWALAGLTNLSYILCLTKKSQIARQALFGKINHQHIRFREP